MMEYECIYNSDLDIIETKTHGSATLREVVEMLQSIVDLCLEKKTADILVDHSDLDASHLSMDQIQQISDEVAPLVDIIAHRKVAHVATHDLQFGLVRAWEIMTDSGGIVDLDTMVFRPRSDAIKWFKSNSQ